MLASPITLHHKPDDGPRPINLSRDIRPVLELLSVSFGPVLDSGGRRILSDRLSTSYYGAPLLLRLNTMIRGFIPGFVWEEDGRIVGNVSLLQSDMPGRYLIANVAVHPEFRRQGMARALMDVAIEHIASKGGREILLQADSSNEAGQQLYKSLGFVVVGALGRWQAAGRRLRVPDLDNKKGVPVRPLERGEWKAAFELDQKSMSVDLNWPTPPPPDKYKVTWWRALMNNLGGRRLEFWVVKRGRNDGTRQLTGLAIIDSDWTRPYKLGLRIHPAYRGEVERPLLAKSVSRLQQLRAGRITIEHPADDEFVKQLLLEANFRARRTLTVMRFALGH